MSRGGPLIVYRRYQAHNNPEGETSLKQSESAGEKGIVKAHSSQHNKQRKSGRKGLWAYP